MNTNHTAAPAVGPITADLFAALRAYETAYDRYYCAVTAMRNPATAGDREIGLTPTEQSAFDAARAFIQEQLQDRIMSWANATDPEEPM